MAIKGKRTKIKAIRMSNPPVSPNKEDKKPKRPEPTPSSHTPAGSE